jgi:prevent-host-death family protein
MRVTIHQAKTQFSEILRRVAAGEEVVILNRNRPVARVIAWTDKTPKDLEGDLAGRIRVDDDFDALPQGFEEYT